jgi:hypothetical protein
MLMKRFGDGCHECWVTAASVVPAVDLNQKFDRGNTQCFHGLMSPANGVDTHGDSCFHGKGLETSGFVGRQPQRIGEEYVRDSGINEDFGFTNSGQRDTPRAVVKLQF